VRHCSTVGSSRGLELVRNLAGCLLAGLVVFGLAVFREIEFEDHPMKMAVSTGLVAGGLMALLLGVLVVLSWSRDRHQPSYTGSDHDG
jgi:hypothetical protein